MINFLRLKQVINYGWKHSGTISKNEGFSAGKRIAIFIDILRCFNKYKMWSNQYVKEKFYSLSKQERSEIGARYREKGIIRDRWQRDFQENQRFLEKYASLKWDRVALRQKKINAYRQRYGMGEGCLIEHDVHLSRQHYLEGTIRIGNHVLLAKHAFIDYSGEVILEDGVKIANGVIILSHHSDIDAYNRGLNVNIPTTIRICENAYIGSRAMILDSCNYIGKNARVGAGAVVTKDVPDNALVAGVPAKVIRYIDQQPAHPAT